MLCFRLFVPNRQTEASLMNCHGLKATEKRLTNFCATCFYFYEIFKKTKFEAI